MSTEMKVMEVDRVSASIGWTEIVLVLTTFLLSYVYYSWTVGYEYWSKRNVPYLKPRFPFGNVTDVFLFKKNFRDSFLNLYNRVENNRFAGIFSLKSPVLIVKDPKLIKLMLTKDFGHFVDRFSSRTNSHESLLNSIVVMEGEVWKQMRTKLSPAFTSGKMKMMFPIMSECSHELDLCLKNIFRHERTFEAKELMSRYTLDTFVTNFFGLQATAINDGNCELYRTSAKLLENSFWRSFSNIMFVEAPNWYSRLRMHMLQYDACQSIAGIIKETVELRERQNIVRNDFLDLLIKLKNNVSIDDKDMDYALNNNVAPDTVGNTDKCDYECKLKVDDVMTQIMGFFVGGFETTSSGLAFCLYELSRNPDVQVRARREVDKAYERHGSVTYRMLQELTYLDNVISETLRMYSSVSMINRICAKPYRIPDTDVVIEKGCRVVIPSYAIHHDPKYYPDPFKFDPDRFTEENVKSRPAYTYLPFGEGPRMCIGMRFAKLQMKLALVTLLLQFHLKLNPMTPVPLTIACGEFFTRTRDQILLDLCDRNDFCS